MGSGRGGIGVLNGSRRQVVCVESMGSLPMKGVVPNIALSQNDRTICMKY